MTMTSHEPWTIERIGNVLGTPALRQQFLGEINTAPVHELVTVFAKWQGIAASIADAVERGRELLAQAGSDGDLPGDWIDITDEIRTKAERLRGQAA